MTTKPYLCIHGHFYQPPRENAWLESIEIQDSASPFHDWNERIDRECYEPNGLARVLDEKGKIIDMANNYERMSFNFGPTLIKWIKDKDPFTYQQILQADRISIEERGFGNAIAQAYNHMIMPLANRRDKVTQVRWGIEDFKHHFKRNPDAMWLPETACNEETLEVLVEEGIRFIILEPHQAEAVRPLDQKDWHDVSSGQIDPKIPYRCFLKKDSTRFIDIFFYDGPISKETSFGNLLYDAKHFMDALTRAKVDHHDGPQLIHISVDGETFGHHKAFGDRALAYLQFAEAKQRGYELVNYSQFLEMRPPKDEVRLKLGENGEGTSWSCAHGVKRWKEHCGCRGDGPGDWTQHWRKPLREALDWLRDNLAQHYEDKCKSVFKDAWEARNDYVHVILNRSEETVHEFFEKHATHILTDGEVTQSYNLLELQRNAMLMYTSCGWFFSEISGIETVQIMQYAARAIQLAVETGARPSLEEEFLALLTEAKSNVKDYKDGRTIYERFVKPAKITLYDVAGHHAIRSMFEDAGETEHWHCFSVQTLHQRKESYGNLRVNFGRVYIRSVITREEKDLLFVVTQFGPFDFHCAVKEFEDGHQMDRFEKELLGDLHSIQIVELIRRIDALFGSRFYALKDLIIEERLKMITLLTRGALQKIGQTYEHIFEESRRINEVYRTIHLPIPEDIRYAMTHTLSKRLHNAVMKLSKHQFNMKKAIAITRIMEMANSFQANMDKTEISVYLTKRLDAQTQKILLNPKEDTVSECINILKLAKKIETAIDLRHAQKNLFQVLRAWREDQAILRSVPASVPQKVVDLATALDINPKAFKIEIKEELHGRTG